MADSARHKWVFRTRFRRNVFGWKSQPAIKRIREAVSEIRKVARKDAVLAAEGAVLHQITSVDVHAAYEHTMPAAGNAACANRVQQRIRDLVAEETFGERFVTGVLGRRLGLS